MSRSLPLKPCPFCGSHDVEDVAIDYPTKVVACKNCGARGPTSTRIDAAVAAWNLRATSRRG